MGWSEYDYRNGEALEAALAESLRSLAVEAVAARGRAVFALSGGSTPFPLYRRTAATDAPWSKVWLLPTDERCVPHAHPACNFTALCNAWAAAEDIEVLSLTTSDGDPATSEILAREHLARVTADFDAVILGMGGDTHTASLFPGAVQLAAGLAIDAPEALRIDPQPLPPEAPFARITLSAARLRRTRQLHLVIVGEAKREALRRAQASHDPMLTPISAFLHDDDVRVHIHWSP
jgi:6-phosphogluconolactonase